MKKSKIKLTKDQKIKMLRKAAITVTKELQVVEGYNCKLRNLTQDLKDEIANYKRKRAFDNERIRQRDRDNVKLAGEIASLHRAIHILGSNDIQKDYLDWEAEHSGNMEAIHNMVEESTGNKEKPLSPIQPETKD